MHPLAAFSLALAPPLAPAPGQLVTPTGQTGLFPDPSAPTGDVPAPGLAVHAELVGPPFLEDPFGLGFGTFGVVRRLPDGTVATFDGQRVRRLTAGGHVLDELAVLPAPSFAAFLREYPGGDALLAGESSDGVLWRVELDGTGAVPVAGFAYPYDAAFLDGDTVVVNAAGCIGCDTELQRLDLPGGSATTLVVLSGPSGPVAHDGAGGVYVGDYSASLVGPMRVLHFPAALLEGPLPVEESDGVVVSEGYDAISSLAYDPELGRLYVAESDVPVLPTSVYSIKLAGGDAATDVVLMESEPGRWLADLQLVPGALGVFHPYQPSPGGRLEVSSTDFAADEARRLTLFGAQPRASFEGPGTSGSGSVVLRLEGAPPLGSAIPLVAPSSALVEPYVLSLAGLLPWALELDLGQVDASGPLAVDGGGVAEVELSNSSGQTGVLAVQLVCIDAGGTVVGLSTAAVL